MKNLLLGEFKTLNENAFLLKYENDYALDDILEQGVKSIGDLVSFLQKKYNLKKGDLKMNKGGYACTTFNAVNEAGQYIFARNFDYKEAPCIVVWTAPEKGYKSVAITDTNVMLYGKKVGEKENKNRLLMAPYACMDGINEKGLAIAVVEIKTKATKQETGKKPITTTVAIRAALDKCATVEEVVELFSSFDMHDSLFCNYHYQVTDANGKSVVIEYVNNEMRVIEPEEGKNQYLLNFYLSKDGECKKGFGYTREKWLHEEFDDTKCVMSEERAMQILRRCKLLYKHKRGYMITSLWSAVYNNSEKTMLFCANMDYDRQYKFSVDYNN